MAEGFDREERIKAASETLRSHFSSLVKSIDPLMVAVELFSKSIVDSSIIEKVQLTSITNTQKAVLVLTAVSNVAKANPDIFTTFCKVLDNEPATKDIAKLLKDDYDTAPVKYRESQQESKRLFNEAMKQGHVLLHTNTLMLMGVAGSGKTSVKDLLLDKPPKEERHSTPVRDRILHVRPVTNRLIQSIGKKWEEVSHQDMVHLLAQAVRHLPRISLDKLSSDLQSRLKQMSLSPAASGSAASGNLTPPSLVTPIDQAISAVVDLVVEAMISVSGHEVVSIQSKKGTELFGTKTMRVMDNGGQPQFQDIASLFVRHASAGLFVMRLIDDFDAYPLDELYKDGELVGTPSPSHLSHGETILSLLRSFLSHGENPKFIFIGTFLDELKESEIVSEKNKRLLDMLSPALRSKMVYSSSSMNEIIFPLNACSRNADTLSVANEIREAVDESPSIDIEVPLWWFVIELSLQNLSSRLGRGILRKSECVELAHCLKFDREALEAALVYFDEMCIAHYYPEILPDIVFVDPQVPLDKVSELTQHAIFLRGAREKNVRSAKSFKWKRFRDEGVLMISMLESKDFRKHFEEGLFGPADLLAIMRELMIIAPLSPTVFDEADCRLPETEFFMPSLLRSVPPSELEMHRVFNSSADPLLIRFVSGCIRCGVFCCLVVYLMKDCGWQVCLPSGEPALLARNCVKFRFPKSPCSITLIDSFSYIEVHVKAPLPVCKGLCPLIRKCIISGIELASDSLHYNNDHPEIAIFCPHIVSSKQAASKSIFKKHYAEVDSTSVYWCCSLDIDCSGPLESKHTVWLDNQSTIGALSDTDDQIDQIARDVGINLQVIDEPCSQHHLLPISQHLEHWSSYGERLGLTRVEIESIETDIRLTAPHAKGLEMLMTWQKICGGMTVKASYRHLLRGCVEINRDLRVVRYICNLIKSKV